MNDEAFAASSAAGAHAQHSWHQVVRYDWKAAPVPQLDSDWRPTRSLSVVIPAYNCQEALDRTLAALSFQTYPPDLFEVVVADDGSTVPLSVPTYAPQNTRVIHLDRETEWGRARACHAGAVAAEGEILLFLDADMVVYPDHLRAHARWHHVIAEAVTLGHKLFVDFDGITVKDVVRAAECGSMFELAADRPFQEHEWVERVLARLHDLTVYDPEMFKAAVGATVGMRAGLYREAGGFRTNLRAGEDMEMGYRLMTAGAVFVPERQARSWHQGPATFMSRAAEVRRRNDPHFANYVPVPGRFRPPTPGRQYAVPMISVNVSASTANFESLKCCIDSALASDETDLRIHICCQSESDDYDLLHAQYQDDARLRLDLKPLETGYPSPFTVLLPEWAQLASGSLGALLRLLEEENLGVLRVGFPRRQAEEDAVVVWRTAALHRAKRHETSDEHQTEVAQRLFGSRRVDAADFGIVDLQNVAPGQRLAKPPTVPSLLRRLQRADARVQQLRLDRLRLRGELDELRARYSALRQKHRRLRSRYDRLRQRRLVRFGNAVSTALRRRRG